jgi:hypothetical protein
MNTDRKSETAMEFARRIKAALEAECDKRVTRAAQVKARSYSVVVFRG